MAALAFCALAAQGDDFTLASKTFEAGGVLPPAMATVKVSGGENMSPELSWKNIPSGSASLALFCADTNPIASNWVHWAVLDIPVSVSSLPRGVSGKKMPPGARELDNSFGFKGYGGPQPPPGTGVHRYVFTLYALSAPETPFTGRFMSEAEFQRAAAGKILGKASLTGTFSR
jgi:Raf kinase inhibitor-like YbhB/YbcL family protein